MSLPRRPDLEGARGIIVSAVVGYHALRLVLVRHGGDWGDVAPMWWPAATGRLGVDAFFVLAGYLVVESWHSCRARAASTASAVAEFARRRSWRILPPYLAMLVVVVPVAAPQVLTHGGDLAQLLTVQQYFDPALTQRVNVPIWSLTTEIDFYLFAPIVAVLTARRLGWRIVLPASALAVWWAHTDARGDLPAGLLPGRLDQFLVGAAAGALLAAWGRGERSRLVEVLTSRAALPVLCVALVGVGTYHGATWRTGDDGVLPLLVHPVAGWILAGLLVRLIAGPTPRLLLNPALVWLGGVSFSLYLWHYPILEHGLAQVDAGQPTGLVTLFALILVAAGVAVAALFRDLVELPVRRREAARRRPADRPEEAAERAVSTPLARQPA
ncbi:MAG: acyltransferase family protein [Acidimicrobiales bacterium]